MKKIMTPEVSLINLCANDILTTSNLSVGADITSGTISGDAPARPAIFDAPVASEAPAANNGGTIWQ